MADTSRSSPKLPHMCGWCILGLTEGSLGTLRGGSARSVRGPLSPLPELVRR